jgi:hypothetical protein
MTMKEHELYCLYENYLSDQRVDDKRRKLLLISRDYFDRFVEKFTKDPFFRSRYQSLLVNLVREKKLRRLSEENDKENQHHVGRR